MHQKKMTIPEMFEYALEHIPAVNAAVQAGQPKEDTMAGIALAILDTLAIEAGDITLN